MFWDRVAVFYDIFAYGINRKANKGLCSVVSSLIAPSDDVLECACGTGLLTEAIAAKCHHLIASDYSLKMLDKARHKCRNIKNIEFRNGNILSLQYPDESFDAVIAANVIHLLDNPEKAISEMHRVCRSGGLIIIPTYINKSENGHSNSVTGIIGKAGAGFKREFSYSSYKEFISSAGYGDAEYMLSDGLVPCAIAVIKKH